ncbi:MAG: ribonuclease III [Clostridiales bacterium]|nr:ribonuclease III [Clostridiales bacterium]
MEKIGYRFRDEKLLRLALRHPSMGAENNQRLEFLGDAVLEMCISDRIYLRMQNLHEGEMTTLRQRLVCEEALAHIARMIDLGPQIVMEKGCEQTGGREKNSVLSDAMEAVLAAVYLDGGFHAAKDVIDRLWPDDLVAVKRAPDPKSALQEWTQAHMAVTPRYVLLSESGPAHQREFEVAVLLRDTEYARAKGMSKKKAEQSAAQTALDILRKNAGNKQA